MVEAKAVVACDMWSDADGCWFAAVWDADKPAPRGYSETVVGRSGSRIDAIAQAMKMPRLHYASAIDEERVAIAAYRARPMKIMTRGHEVHFMGLR